MRIRWPLLFACVLAAGLGAVTHRPSKHRLVRDADRLILASSSGYQTVSMRDGGRTGLYYDAPEELLRGIPHMEHVVLLGLGGGEMLRAARRAQPKAELVGVELDAATIDLAKSDFGLEALGVTAVQADAIDWIGQQPQGSIDVLMVDLFADDKMVEASTQNAFLGDCARAMHPLSLFLMNVYPAGRSAAVEARLQPFFVTERRSYGQNIVLVGLRRSQ